MHQPVMLKEVMSSLNLKRGDKVLDATVGLGGHAREILKRILPEGRLIGLDVDEEALERASTALKEYEGSFKLIKGNFRNLDAILLKENIRGVDACLFDLGVSSYQLDDASRGFGIKNDSRLDMRMDLDLKATAYTLVNKLDRQRLSDVIDRFGEERFHNRIAAYIVRERARKPIETTHELADIVRRAVGPRRQKIDPATRTFQALRIAVNGELDSLEEGLKKAIAWLDFNARICVLSFHSLEDRIVKNLFRSYSQLGVLRIITKKPLRPSSEEIVLNPRSRSARLRCAERIQ